MEQLLHRYYGVQANNKVIWDHREGLQDSTFSYFIIPSANKEELLLEQGALAQYLAYAGYRHVTVPMYTWQGEWFTNEEPARLGLKAQPLLQSRGEEPGKQLAAFHDLGSQYPYEPILLSSYGQWRELWIEKLTAFESKLMEIAKQHKRDYDALIVDSLPYIVGLSENAIQYVQESVRETKHSPHDQGSIVFWRYTNQLQKPIIWMEDLAFDHPMRDVAELVRNELMKENGIVAAVETLRSYNDIRPISTFGWRLLYARLLFPVHLFDCLEEGLATEKPEQAYQRLSNTLDQQTKYETGVRELFHWIREEYAAINIPMVDWL
ncbi:hypothetical protein DX933_03455 [Ornithinibacillus gellani]|uniref:hypothetical protein n=1 Tax=Ornithinibacillus gellani TaxID=2293253 RepID=UPI000F49668F|nr:hypothetical protein [Ornithinibacillus gellani]TQS75989.1 hypothetical protein DX933_03455 [Ornithinibacillus gellani]